MQTGLRMPQLVVLGIEVLKSPLSKFKYLVVFVTTLSQDDLLTSSTDSLEDDFKEDSKDLVGNRFNIDKVLSQDTTISDISDPGKLIEETTRLRNLVEEINR